MPAAPQGPRGRLTRADREALTDARIAGIQAGLKLSADQQRLWPPLEQAIRAQAAARAARIEARLARMQERRQRREERQAARPDLMQRLEQRAERADRRADQVEKRAETLQGLVAALRPFWASLNEDQRRILPILMRDRESRRAGRDRRHGPMHHGMHHPGPRP
jgi:chromosome segregation ATPase